MKKILLSFSVLFFLAAACGKNISPTSPVSNNKRSLQPQAEILEQKIPNPAVSPLGAKPISQSPPQTQIVQPQTQSEQKITSGFSVQQTVDGSSTNQLNSEYKDGESAIDVLRREHTIETKVYPGMGEMVLKIDGVEPDNKHFWKFYVNGKASHVGASSYKLQNGDQLFWTLEEIN